MRLSILLAAWLSWASAAAQVERASFDAGPFSLGTLTEADGALGRDLWQGAQPDAIRSQLAIVPTRFDDPAKRMMLRRVLLTPGEGPMGADAALAGLKLLKAVEAGYAMEAGAVAELTPGLGLQPELSRIVAMRDLYRGNVEQACGRGANLREGRQTAFFVRLRVLCYIHAGERPAAELTLNLAREEDVLAPGDARLFRSVLSGSAPSEMPRGAIQYAAYRRLGGSFDDADLQDLPPSMVAAIAYDSTLDVALRQEALRHVVVNDLVSPRDLEDIAASLKSEQIGKEIAAIRSLPPASQARGGAIGQALQAVVAEPTAFLLRVKVFEADIASTGVNVATVPYAAEFALASLLNRRYKDAESWMQTVAAEQSLGAERAFLNLALLYSYVKPSAAQRLAGAIGEEIASPDVAPLTIADETASLVTVTDLSVQMEHALNAAASGSRGALLLSALGTAAVEAETSELELIRDTLGADLYRRGNAEPIVREAAFRREALAAAGRLRDDRIGKDAYIPRLKPSSSAR
ncbi:MAG: hypothetical protein HRU11_02205 [Parvularculaceae bacterium]|nr:hypothetical protein [Parvularculaceae bacterium]